MSDLRVGLVAEGPTDHVVIEAALRSVLYPRTFVLTLLQPEGSVAFGSRGGGWAGVYRWCLQASGRGSGRLRRDQLLFEFFDLIILHLDADVAESGYAAGSITPRAADRALPCAQPCPPAAATTGALREVLWSWCGEQAAPSRTATCLPSKSMEAWVVVALFPTDPAVVNDIECLPNPASRLGQQPTPQRIRKSRNEYLARSRQIESAWPRVTQVLSEAARFALEVTGALGQAPS